MQWSVVPEVADEDNELSGIATAQSGRAGSASSREIKPEISFAFRCICDHSHRRG